MSDADPAVRLQELAQELQRASVAGVRDLYLERTVDVVWHLEEGIVAGRETLRREGAAVRRGQVLCSADGLDRITIAEITGLNPAQVPPLRLPAAPAAPKPEEAAPLLPRQTEAVRWRWRWAAVVRPGSIHLLRRPQLLEITVHRGRRILRTWPPDGSQTEPAAKPPPGSSMAPVPTKPVPVLLAPPAAAVLLHELFGHPCEADMIVAGRSLWHERLGDRVLDLPLTVLDDPEDFSLPGAFDTDDEGEPAVRRPLVHEGRLVGVLADRRLAPRFKTAPGSARRAHIHAPPRPRLSNLVVVPAAGAEPPPRQDARVEVTAVAGGTADPVSGRVFLAVSAAHTLQRGHPTRPLPPFTLVTTTAALASGLAAAGRGTAEAADHGWCGKGGEVLATGARAPWLLVTGLEVR